MDSQPRLYEAEVTLEDGSDAKQMINERDNLVKVRHLQPHAIRSCWIPSLKLKPGPGSSIPYSTTRLSPQPSPRTDLARNHRPFFSTSTATSHLFSPICH